MLLQYLLDDPEQVVHIYPCFTSSLVSWHQVISHMERYDNGIYESLEISLHVSVLSKVTMIDSNYHSQYTGETEALQLGCSYIVHFSKHCLHTFPVYSQMLAWELGHGCPHQIHKRTDAVMLADLFRATVAMPEESAC